MHAKTRSIDSQAVDYRLRESIRAYDASPTAFADRWISLDFSGLRKQLLEACDDPPNVIVDAGCGPGRDCAAFCSSAKVVFGVDLSTGLLELAERYAPGARLVHADLRAMPIRTHSVDAVWSMASLVHVDHEGAAQAIREFKRVLRPGAPMLISVPLGLGHLWRADVDGTRWFQLHTRVGVAKMLREEGLTIEWSQAGVGVVRGNWVTALARSDKDLTTSGNQSCPNR